MLSKEEIYKTYYMQIPVTMLTEENLDKLEEHCKKTIHFERGKEHSVTLELLYKYRQLESDNQKLIEKLKEDIENSSRGMDANIILIKEYYKNKKEYAQEILEILKGEENEQYRS